MVRFMKKNPEAKLTSSLEAFSSSAAKDSDFVPVDLLWSRLLPIWIPLFRIWAPHLIVGLLQLLVLLRDKEEKQQANDMRAT